MRIWSVIAIAIILYVAFGRHTEKSINKTTPSPLAIAKARGQVVNTHVFRKPASTGSEANVDPFKQKLQELADLKACYSSHTCAFPDTDPRSYEIALGKKIKEELNSLRLVYSRNPKNFKQLQTVAKDFMSTGDGFVQEESLKILSTLPISQESLSIITEGLVTSPDPSLMEQALTEFQRYMGTPLETNVHSFLSGTISTGAQFSSVTVSEKIQPFLNTKSYPVYEKTLSKMTPGAKAASNLSAALREYRRSQTGA